MFYGSIACVPTMGAQTSKHTGEQRVSESRPAQVRDSSRDPAGSRVEQRVALSLRNLIFINLGQQASKGQVNMSSFARRDVLR